LKFVNVIIRFPYLIFWSLIVTCLAVTFLLGSLVGQEGNPITEDTYAYEIDDVRSIAYDSLRLAREDVKLRYEIAFNETQGIRRLEEGNATIQNEIGGVTYWIYDAKTDEGIFTQEGVQALRAAESTALEHEEYSKYCKLEYNETDGTSECLKPLSSMNAFYASVWDAALVDEIISEFKNNDTSLIMYNVLAPCVEFELFCTLPSVLQYNDNQKAWVADLNQKMISVMSNWDGKGDLNPDVQQVTEFMAYMNLIVTKKQFVNFYFDSGFSVENQKSMYSRSILYWGELLEGTKDSEESEKKLKEYILENLIKEWNKSTNSNNNEEVQSYYFMGVLIWDLILNILIFDGVKAIASFVFVFFYLRLMLGSWFLSAVGMFEIVMSLPLAWISFSFIFQIKYFSALNVLCIFIVTAIGADDIFVFMDSYKQSAHKGTEIVSSFETRMSWVFRRSGSAMLITSVTTCSAFLCTLFSPIAGTKSFGIFAAFVILFDYVLVMTLFCCSVVIYHDRFENKPYCCSCTFWKKSDSTPTENALRNQRAGEEPKIDIISLFFRDKLAPFILNGRNRIFIGLVLLTVIIVSAIYTAKLEPTTSAEQFLDEDHPLQIGVNILSNEFPKTQNDESSKIYFTWGLNSITRDGVNQLLDPEFVGEVSYSTDFTFNEECQSAILDACTKLRTDPDLQDFILDRDGLRSVDCFVEELGAFNVNNDATCNDVQKGDWRNDNWQVAESDLEETMKKFVNQTACGEGSGQNVRTYYADNLGWDGESIRYAGISVDSSRLDFRQVLAENVVRVHYDKFIEVAEELDKTLEGVCKTKTIMTDLDQKFIFMNNQRIYRTSAVSGSMVGVIVAFVVLFISTRKLHISLFATISILCVLIGVIGSVTIIGWTLGVIEAIMISILAGFSVDYVIHLAHAYTHAEGDTDERIKAAFGDMGISVFSGMLTSVVASIPLFFCTLTFFAKFGTFLCLTIVLSWIFANFGFMSLLAQFKVPMDKKWL
jgi:hypothetical protein